MAGPAKAETHGKLAGQSTHGRGRDTVNADVFLLFVVEAIPFLDEVGASASASYQNADAAQLVALERGGFDAGIFQRLSNSGQAERDDT